ncbi:MAG: HigA family addiction module antitoxin [Myxococcota bacterium]
MSITTDRLRVRRREPSHPGAILVAQHLEPLGITISEAAVRLGVSRKTLSKIINERGAVTPEMALRFGRAFGTTAQLWLNLQQAYDLWHAERETPWRAATKIRAHAGERR